MSLVVIQLASYGHSHNLAIVQMIALVYTARSNIFIVIFCGRGIPHLRDWVCSDYDKLSNMKPGTIDIREPLANMIRISNIFLTLPHWLSRWETNIRSLRASLPALELSKEDQSILRGEFTEYIALHSDTLDAAQFHENHVTGTMKRFFSGSKVLTRGFKNGGLLEPRQGLHMVSSRLVWNGYIHGT